MVPIEKFASPVTGRKIIHKFKTCAGESGVATVNQHVSTTFNGAAKAFNQAKKSKRMEDWVRFKSIRNQLKQSVKRAELEYFKRLSEQSARNPRKAWQEVSRLLGSGSRSEISVLRSEKGEITCPQNVADEFGRFFSKTVGVTK